MSADYLDEDGSLRCGACHKRKQIKINIMGKVHTVNCLCDCEAKERQKISISVEKKDAVTEEKLEGVIFELYAREDILSQQGEVLVEKDTLLEKKATDENGQITFDSDLYYGKYYVKEEVRKLGYLPNEEVWKINASYENQNLAEIQLTKEIENQPTESHFTKTDATTGEELEGAKLQIIDKDGNIVEEYQIAAILKADVFMLTSKKNLFIVRRDWRFMYSRQKHWHCLKQG